MIRVISIPMEYEVILGFLFPDYSISDSAAVTTKFIVHRNIRSKSERESLDLYYSDGIFISSQIFDEFWDMDKIKEECILFSRHKFKNRKKTFNTTKETFIKDCIDFIFGIDSVEEDQNILNLFDLIGSARFPIEYFRLTNFYSVPQVNASLFTFFSKLSKDSASIYYKRRALLLEDKFKRNLIGAIDNFNLRCKDSVGASSCKFFMDLVL